MPYLIDPSLRGGDMHPSKCGQREHPPPPDLPIANANLLCQTQSSVLPHRIWTQRRPFGRATGGRGATDAALVCRCYPLTEADTGCHIAEAARQSSVGEPLEVAPAPTGGPAFSALVLPTTAKGPRPNAAPFLGVGGGSLFLRCHTEHRSANFIHTGGVVCPTHLSTIPKLRRSRIMKCMHDTSPRWQYLTHQEHRM